MPELSINHHKTFADLLPHIPRIMSYPSLGLDIESTGLDYFRDSIISVQIANGEDNTVDILDVRKDNFKPFFNYFEVYKGRVYIQNAKFDLKFLRANFNLLYLNDLFDTMLAEKVLESGRLQEGFGLDDLSARYLNLKMSKSVRNEFILPMFQLMDLTEEQKTYGGLDAWVLPRIGKLQEKRLEEDGLTRIASLEFGVLPVIIKAEMRGSKLDTDAWTAIYKEEQALANSLGAKLREISGDKTFNPNSSEQVKAVMRRLGLKVPEVKGKETTREIFLNKIKHPFIQTLLDYRTSSKRVSTYGEEFLNNINPLTGRIHAEFDQLGTETGRMSSEKPNFQNIPKREDGAKFRKCFITDDGKQVVSCDFSGQELMIMTELSKDPELLRVYTNGLDIHTNTGSMIFETDYDKVTKGQRGIAKTFNYAASYQSSAWNISNTLHIPLADTERYLAKFWNTYNGLQKWQRRSGLTAWHKGYSTTMWGRRRYYNDCSVNNKDSVMRQGSNQEIQGTAADMLKLSLVKIDDWIRKNHSAAEFTKFVHDEVVLDSPNWEAEEVAVMVKSKMEEAGAEFVKVIKQKADVNVGDYWM
jgi:DNA polymerase-1